jgi:hypothetical protein
MEGKDDARIVAVGMHAGKAAPVKAYARKLGVFTAFPNTVSARNKSTHNKMRQWGSTVAPHHKHTFTVIETRHLTPPRLNPLRSRSIEEARIAWHEYRAGEWRLGSGGE